jgi:hypothetical protein
MQNLKLRFFIAFAAMVISFALRAQDNTLGDRNAKEEEVTTGTSKKAYRLRLTRKQRLLLRHPKVKHSAEYEFYARVEKAAREKQKMLRKMAKPQYSNFLYYGHKSPPKKHLPFQMRYCKECGIRH